MHTKSYYRLASLETMTTFVHAGVTKLLQMSRSIKVDIHSNLSCGYFS